MPNLARASHCDLVLGLPANAFSIVGKRSLYILSKSDSTSPVVGVSISDSIIFFFGTLSSSSSVSAAPFDHGNQEDFSGS